jgi:hypothetical protein
MEGERGVAMAKKESVIEVEGRQIKLSNLEKVLYPKAGFTKGQVIDYYIRIAPVLLPHLANRALTLKRYPNGVDGMFFYEKNCPTYRPSWMKTAKIWSEGNNRFMDYCVVADLPTLVWLGIPVRLPPLCSAAKSASGCAIFLSSSDCRLLPRPPGQRDCKFTFL